MLLLLNHLRVFEVDGVVQSILDPCAEFGVECLAVEISSVRSQFVSSEEDATNLMRICRVSAFCFRAAIFAA